MNYHQAFIGIIRRGQPPASSLPSASKIVRIWDRRGRCYVYRAETEEEAEVIAQAFANDFRGDHLPGESTVLVRAEARRFYLEDPLPEAWAGTGVGGAYQLKLHPNAIAFYAGQLERLKNARSAGGNTPDLA